MRSEQITARALSKVNGDRYILSIAVAKRAVELESGKEALIQVDKKKYKYTDIALMEIAEGFLKVSDLIDK
jgi:DNA-directed RNA polymerase subunit omega